MSMETNLIKVYLKLNKCIQVGWCALVQLVSGWVRRFLIQCRTTVAPYQETTVYNSKSGQWALSACFLLFWSRLHYLIGRLGKTTYTWFLPKTCRNEKKGKNAPNTYPVLFFFIFLHSQHVPLYKFSHCSSKKWYCHFL